MSSSDTNITSNDSPYAVTFELLLFEANNQTFEIIILSIYYSTIAPFYHIRTKERGKYATLLHCRTGQK